jgi:hypothetical protein
VIPSTEVRLIISLQNQKELMGKSTPKDVFYFMHNELGRKYHHRKELNILIGYARS